MRFHYLLPELTGVDVISGPGDRLYVIIKGLNDTVELVGTADQLAVVARQILRMIPEGATDGRPE